MIQLAMQYGQGPVLVSEIEEKQCISGNYIHTLATELKSAGLITAKRGKKGGYELARHPKTITAHEIITRLEGEFFAVHCIKNPSNCERSHRCAAADLWAEITASVNNTLFQYNLEQLALREKQKTSENLIYHI